MTKSDAEDARACQAWGTLAQDQRPACAGENGGFMSEKPHTRVFRHVYARPGNRHAALLPTQIDIPPYAAQGVPFRYMSKDYQPTLRERHPEFCDDVEAPFTTSWIYGERRQHDILSWFRSQVAAHESLCVFYCKHGTPVDDDCQRLIVGLGEVTKVHPLLEYESTQDFTYPLWELVFEHSIRRDLAASKGFLLPYHQYLELDEEEIKRRTGLSKEEALDEIKLTPDKLQGSQRLVGELSYGCDFVSNPSMLAILEGARSAIEAVMRHQLVAGDWTRQLRWINDSIAKVKSMLTPFPAFAEALKAMGVNYAYLIEQDLRHAGCGPKDNPWQYFERLLQGGISTGTTVYTSELPLYRQTWEYQPAEAKAVLQLLSRFDIPSELIRHYLERPEEQEPLLQNPYLLSEACAWRADYPVTTQTIDLGVMADAAIQGSCLPQPPSLVSSVIDRRRLRSLVIERLCQATDQGDTLLSIEELETHLEQTLQQESNARLPLHVLHTLRPFFSTEMAYIPDDRPQAVQLKSYFRMEELLRRILLRRAAKEVRRPVPDNWEAMAKACTGYNPQNARSVSATAQQTEALRMMASKRLSVLTGGAGTGKTTVVRSFLRSEHILQEGVLLLAPTGKARVRLGNMAQNGRGIEAKTVAQFLTAHQRFDYNRMQPCPNDSAPKYAKAKNVIIDECSMLTTPDLYVLLDALDLSQINRIILIGDPYQLPPIGAGRPFSDLCHHLLKAGQTPQLASAITCLKSVVRTIGSGPSDVLTLASWFGGDKPQKDADEIFSRIERQELSGDLRVCYWHSEEDLTRQLQDALCRELQCDTPELGRQLKAVMGLDDADSLFGAPQKLEEFQILTPVLHPMWGTYQLNDFVQRLMGNTGRNGFMQFSTQRIYPYDKVIQLQNERRKGFPSGLDRQLSNGQIGFVKSIRLESRSSYCNVTFAGLPRETFGYTSVKGEDSDCSFELAYSITIHKSQGSDFGTVLVVLPKSGRILSRELIYTALTRARKRVVLLVQDHIHWLRELAKPQASALARRNSNLFDFSVRREKAQIPYVEGLIHSTKPDSQGKVVYVRSKSEVIIANELISAGIPFAYEKLLEVDGRRCIPDFTFASDDGDTILWEHLGLLDVPEYREAWEKKLAFYQELGFVEGETLFTTRDHPHGAFTTQDVLAVIEKLKKILL